MKTKKLTREEKKALAEAEGFYCKSRHEKILAAVCKKCNLRCLKTERGLNG